MKRLFIVMVAYLSYGNSFAQVLKDTSKGKELKEVIIKSWQRRDISVLPNEQNGFLNAGKKSEMVT